MLKHDTIEILLSLNHFFRWNIQLNIFLDFSSFYCKFKTMKENTSKNDW